MYRSIDVMRCKIFRRKLNKHFVLWPMIWKKSDTLSNTAGRPCFLPMLSIRTSASVVCSETVQHTPHKAGNCYAYMHVASGFQCCSRQLSSVWLWARDVIYLHGRARAPGVRSIFDWNLYFVKYRRKCPLYINIF